MPVTDDVPLMLTSLAAHEPVTPAGKPVTIAPVAPVVAYVIFVIAVLIHLVCALVPAAEDSVIVLFGSTVMVMESALGTIFANEISSRAKSLPDQMVFWFTMHIVAVEAEPEFQIT